MCNICNIYCICYDLYFMHFYHIYARVYLRSYLQSHLRNHLQNTFKKYSMFIRLLQSIFTNLYYYNALVHLYIRLNL